MTCNSGGALDIYLEPVLPKPRILILGRSSVAQVLFQLGCTIGYAITVVSSDGAGEGFAGAEIIATQDFNLEHVKVTQPTFVVVSTQGEGDEEALEEALKTNAGYVAFVASKTKAAKVIEFLQARGVSAEKISQIRAPAGLDIGARSPEEIAVSILAEIIQMRASATPRAAKLQSGALLNVINDDVRDPICGMTVDKSKARYKADFQGKTFYFCCAGCKQTFEQSPQSYVALAKA
jgi:xanthine dehydrogenase accessory factor